MMSPINAPPQLSIIGLIPFYFPFLLSAQLRPPTTGRFAPPGGTGIAGSKKTSTREHGPGRSLPCGGAGESGGSCRDSTPLDRVLLRKTQPPSRVVCRDLRHGVAPASRLTLLRDRVAGHPKRCSADSNVWEYLRDLQAQSKRRACSRVSSQNLH